MEDKSSPGRAPARDAASVAAAEAAADALPPSADAANVPALRCTGLAKRFGELVAVDGIDLVVRRGECFGLLGPNGAGKTTSIEMLEGLLPADAGTIEILGQRWGAGDDRALRERIGIQLQKAEFGERLTVEEVLRLFRSLYSRGRPIDEILARLDLTAKRTARIDKLSGGQAQRLSVATALVSDPDVLFLDEPTTGLDPQARLGLWGILERFRRDGGTVILTTHSMDEAARLCDRLAIMDSGRIIAHGSPAELIASLGAEQIIEFEAPQDVPPDELAALRGVESVSRRLDRTVLIVTELSVALPALMAHLERRGVTLSAVSTHQATLEDVFIRLTGKELRDA